MASPEEAARNPTDLSVHSRSPRFVHAIFLPTSRAQSTQPWVEFSRSPVKPLVASSPESILEAPALSGLTAPGAVKDEDAASDVLTLFDQCAPQLLRHVASFGLDSPETEDIVQETFLALFRHVRLGRDQTNLRAWLFQVAHNLALRRRRTMRRRPRHSPWSEALVHRQVDPAPDPEAQLVEGERRRRLRAVVQALSDRERRCLLLRAAGLTYRDIAATLGVSLGGVAKSLGRAVTRLVNADGG
jgi:RNA polymerase sigma-70 factor, ECF subfamily